MEKRERSREEDICINGNKLRGNVQISRIEDATRRRVYMFPKAPSRAFEDGS